MADFTVPDHPFTAAEAFAAGLTPYLLEKLLREGEIRHDLWGVYVPGSWPDSAEARAAAAAHVLPPHCVISDRTASELHGIDVLTFAELDVAPRLEVVSIGGSRASRRKGLLAGQRDLRPDDIMTINGVRVTTPLRTAADLACLRGRRGAFGMLEAYRQEFDITTEELVATSRRFTRRRGVKQFRELAALARKGADSQPESWVAIELYDEGFPMPEAQVRVFVPGAGMKKVENAYEHLRQAAEYDGEENHSEDADREHDDDRRGALSDSAGWHITVVRRDGFSGVGRETWLREFATEFAKRSPDPRGTRRYARGPDLYPRHTRSQSYRPRP